MGLSLDEVLLDASSSSIAISDGTDTLAVNADGSINVAFASGASLQITDGTDTLAVNADGSINSVVSATDLDIRDLSFATDSVDVSGSTVALDAPTLAALENITVSATDLDIRDLTHASDSVQIGDGTDFLAINADGSLNTQSAPYAAMKHSQASVGATAAQVLVSPLSGRRELTIQNEGSQAVYFGFDGTVTAANGIKISKNSSATYLIPEGVDVYMISASGTQDVRFLELG